MLPRALILAIRETKIAPSNINVSPCQAQKRLRAGKIGAYAHRQRALRGKLSNRK